MEPAEVGQRNRLPLPNLTLRGLYTLPGIHKSLCRLGPLVPAEPSLIETRHPCPPTSVVGVSGPVDELGALDMLLHRGRPIRGRARASWPSDPRSHTGLEPVPDGFENASRKVLRLRQRVVVPTPADRGAAVVVDPDFNLDFHVRRVRVPEPGTLREVLDLAEVSLQSPLDISRPLWTVTLVEGLEGGKAATLLHLSHAVTDGVGATAMFAEIYDLEREPAPGPRHRCRCRRT